MDYTLVPKGTGAGKSDKRFKIYDEKGTICATVRVDPGSEGRKIVKWHPWRTYGRQEMVNFLCDSFHVDNIYNY